MKTRERIKRIRKSKTWVERVALAQDHLPGTRFDAIVLRLLDTLNTLESNRPAKQFARHHLPDD